MVVLPRIVRHVSGLTEVLPKQRDHSRTLSFQENLELASNLGSLTLC